MKTATSPADIREIGLRRGMCYGPCPVYTVTLQRAGEATFIGEHFVDLMGEHIASIEAAEFDALTAAAVDLGFESLARNYAIQVTDHATTTTWIVRDGKRHEVEDYGGAGPDELHKFEDLIDLAASKLEWRLRTPPPTQEGQLFVGLKVDDTWRPVGDIEEQHWTQRGGSRRAG